MADQTAPRPINALGGIAGNAVLSPTLGPISNTGGIAAAVTLWAGEMVGYDVSGNIVSASSAACITCVGISRATYNNTTAAVGGYPATTGAAAAISGTIFSGPYSVLGDGTTTAATPYGTDLFVVDNQTVSTTDQNSTGGARLRAGYFVALDSNGNPVCMFGVASPGARNNTSGPYASTPFQVRAVITSIDAYGGSGTGFLTETTAASGFGTQDGVTLVAGDLVVLQEGTTNITAAKDAGPYVVTNMGSATVKWTLERPDWWVTGTAIPYTAVKITEGSIWAGTDWKSFAVKGKLIDTDAPLMFVGRMVQSVALTASAVTITNVGLRSATKTLILASFVVAGGSTSGTIGYGIITAITPGAINTASAVIDALASGMGKNGTSDTSTILVTVINW